MLCGRWREGRWDEMRIDSIWRVNGLNPRLSLAWFMHAFSIVLSMNWGNRSMFKSQGYLYLEAWIIHLYILCMHILRMLQHSWHVRGPEAPSVCICISARMCKKADEVCGCTYAAVTRHFFCMYIWGPCSGMVSTYRIWGCVSLSGTIELLTGMFKTHRQTCIH